MRKASEVTIIKNEETNEPIGLRLGADFCSEHEWGIRDLWRALGVPRANTSESWEDGPNNGSLGLPSYAISKEKMRAWSVVGAHGDIVDFAVLVRSHAAAEYVDSIRNHEAQITAHRRTVALWDGTGFFVRTDDDEMEEALRVLVRGFDQGDFALWTGGCGPFGGGGLTLVVPSLVSPEIAAGMLHRDEAHRDTLAMAHATGIVRTLRAAGRKWFALSPKRTPESKTNTQHQVIFWLNPMEQQKYEARWCTVEDLELWAQDKGPIVKGVR